MKDFEGAEADGKEALRVQLDYKGLQIDQYTAMDESLGNTLIHYMHFHLETLQAMEQQKFKFIASLEEIRFLGKVKAKHYQEALATFNSVNVLLLPRYERSLFLQERGILQRLTGNLTEALNDLTAALKILEDDYNCFKQRGYVKYLLGDLEGARRDAERCLEMGLPDYYGSSPLLPGSTVEFLGYKLQ
jgi:tetratricopeptide (TPR) repeat protein